MPRAIGCLTALAVAAVLVVGPGAAQGAEITVNSSNDTGPAGVGDGFCTVREAVTASNVNAADINADCANGEAAALDVIKLQGPASLATLNHVGADEDANATGDLDVTGGAGPLEVRGRTTGSGGPFDTINGTSADRIFDLHGGTVTIKNVILQAGVITNLSVGGGAIQSQGTDLAIDNSTLASNTAPFGGGILAYGSGSLTITHSTIGGSNLGDGNTASAGLGGGVNAKAPLTLHDSVVSNNTATQAADAAFDSIVAGGVYVDGTTGDIARTTISANKATAADPGDIASAAGIYAFQPGATTIRDTLVQANAVSGGTNSSGGGMSYYCAACPDQLAVVNSTFTGNTVTTGGSPSGGGISTNGSPKLIFSTFAGNAATNGADVVGGIAVTAIGSIFADGTSACNANLTANAYNVDAGSSCVGSTPDNDLFNTNANIGALLDNGGPTKTMALPDPSPALDLVPASSCKDADGTSPLTSDQRGVERPAGALCDAGAYERSTCLAQVIGAGWLIGSSGDDVISGTSGADKIASGAGADTVDPAGGADFVCTGSGVDFLTLTDGVADTADCGPGTDGYRADAGLDLLSACETDLTLGTGTGAAGTTTPPKKKCKKKKKKRAATAKKKCKKKRKK